MFCPQCGAQNAPQAKFCSGCGASLNAAQVGATQPTQQPVAGASQPPMPAQPAYAPPTPPTPPNPAGAPPQMPAWNPPQPMPGTGAGATFAGGTPGAPGATAAKKPSKFKAWYLLIIAAALVVVLFIAGAFVGGTTDGKTGSTNTADGSSSQTTNGGTGKADPNGSGTDSGKSGDTGTDSGTGTSGDKSSYTTDGHTYEAGDSVVTAHVDSVTQTSDTALGNIGALVKVTVENKGDKDISAWPVFKISYTMKDKYDEKQQKVGTISYNSGSTDIMNKLVPDSVPNLSKTDDDNVNFSAETGVCGRYACYLAPQDKYTTLILISADSSDVVSIDNVTLFGTYADTTLRENKDSGAHLHVLPRKDIDAVFPIKEAQKSRATVTNTTDSKWASVSVGLMSTKTGDAGTCDATYIAPGKTGDCQVPYTGASPSDYEVAYILYQSDDDKS